MHDPKDTLTGTGREAWTDYVRYHRERAHSPNTVTNIGGALVQLQRYLNDHHGGADITAATRPMISGYLMSITERGQEKSTARTRHSIFRAFYRFLADEEYITASPMLRVAAPAARYRRPEVLSDAKLAALLGACKPPARAAAGARSRFDALRDEAIIRILNEPGTPRASELCALAVADVDMDSDLITIRHGKGDKCRVVPMSAATARVVSRYRRARAALPAAAGASAMFIGKKGPMTRSGLLQMIKRRGRAAGIGPVFPHQLRHTSAADFHKASGGNVLAMMSLYGWAKPDMAYEYGAAARDAAALATARELGRGNRLGRVS
jgi:site-specific recombinase XerD